jgi:hypothetical protein
MIWKNSTGLIVVGAAKGVQRCALALEEILGDYSTGGHVIGKHGDEAFVQKDRQSPWRAIPCRMLYSVEGSQTHIYAWSKNVTEAGSGHLDHGQRVSCPDDLAVGRRHAGRAAKADPDHADRKGRADQRS